MLFYFTLVEGSKTIAIDEIKSCTNVKSLKKLEEDVKNQSLICEWNRYYACNENVSSVYKQNTTISSENEFLTVLDDVNTTIYGYSCVNYNKTSLMNRVPKRFKFFSMENHSCRNLTCFYTSDLHILFQFLPSCTECIKNTNFINEWIIFFLMGLLCILGNGTVMFRICYDFFKHSKQNKEIHVYTILVLSLALADLLMGVYLVAVSFEIRRKSLNTDSFFTDYRLCNGLGVVSYLSTQVSLSMIVLISCLRLFGTICPYKKVNIKMIFSLIFLSWVIWFIVSILPIMNFKSLKSFFQIGLRDNDQAFFESSFFFSGYKRIFQEIENDLLPSDKFYLKQIFSGITNFSTPEVLTKAIKSFNLINSDESTWSPIGFYNIQYYCTIGLTIGKSTQTYFGYYILATVVFNLILCLIIVFAYFFIYVSLTGCKLSHLCFVLKPFSSSSNANSRNHFDKRQAENRKVVGTITAIVVTDVIVWLGICLTALIIWKKYDIDNGSNDNYLRVYALLQSVMFCLLPINCVANPFIYFHHFWYTYLKKLKVYLTNIYKQASS